MDTATIEFYAAKTASCSYIYRPKGQALEYAELAANPYSGCGHKCAYCYVPRVLHMSNRKDFDAKADERANYIANLTRDAVKYQKANITEQVLLSFTTDPYHPFDTSLTTQVIQVLQEHGLGVCTLSKGGTRALRDLHLFRPERDAHAATLTSMDDEFSRKWESGAALASDRVRALRAYHEAGIFTWVSIEPTLDEDEAKKVVKETHKFVDLYKIGQANYLPITKTMDWESYTLSMIDLCQQLNVKHYIKDDLQKYLPDGYFNPLRVEQHK